MSLKDCIRRALGPIGAMITDWGDEKEKPSEENPTVHPQAEKLRAKINLAAFGCLGRKRPPVLSLVMLIVLLGAAVWVELHLLAVFLGIAIVLSLISYVTIQKWIDIVGDDHDHPSSPNEPPAWRWPKGDDFAGTPA